MESSTVVNIKDGANFEQAAGDTILRAGLRSGIGLAYECNSGGCGGCKFELISGDIHNIWPEAPGLTERDRRKNRHLACQCVANGPVSISMGTTDEYIPPILPVRQRAKLIKKFPITHDITEFQFQSDLHAEFLPGQFAMLDIPGVNGSRAYSVSNIRNQACHWQFQIRRTPHGQGTHHLFDKLLPGSEIGIDGPYGSAYLRANSPRDIVCIAGGSGLAPMLSIARGAANGNMLKNRSLHFFYGARTVRDICGEEQLQLLEGFGERIHYVPVVSLPEDTTQWSGEVGFVHDVIARKLPNPLQSYEYYFAGPPPMTQALQELLMVGYQVPFHQIHFDRFF